MKCYSVYYTLKNDTAKYVFAAYGNNEAEALEYFMVFAGYENPTVTSIELYK